MQDLFSNVWGIAGWPGFIGGIVGVFLAAGGRLNESCYPNCEALWLFGVVGVGVGVVVNQALRWLDSR